MPHSTRTLSIGDCRSIAMQAFQYRGENYGIEQEWVLHEGRDDRARVTEQQLAPFVHVELDHTSAVSIEPGGQIELSTAPQRTLHAATKVLEHDEEVLHAALIEAGFEPWWASIDDSRRPDIVLSNGRYHAMGDFWDKTGGAGRWMMCNTASTQFNIPNDPVDPVRRWQLMNLVGPVLVALFGNSPGVDCTGTRWWSLRQGIWASMDRRRTSQVPLTNEPAEDWLGYALGADVFYIRSGAAGRAVRAGMSFYDWMCIGHETGWPTTEDFRYHLTTLFPPVRPKGWLELRMLDAMLPQQRRVAASLLEVLIRSSMTDRLLPVLRETPLEWRAAAELGLRSQHIRDAAKIIADMVRAEVRACGLDGFDADALNGYLDAALGHDPESNEGMYHLPVRLDEPLLQASMNALLLGR